MNTSVGSDPLNCLQLKQLLIEWRRPSAGLIGALEKETKSSSKLLPREVAAKLQMHQCCHALASNHCGITPRPMDCLSSWMPCTSSSQ